jgi:hypothetical protein
MGATDQIPMATTEPLTDQELRAYCPGHDMYTGGLVLPFAVVRP